MRRVEPEVVPPPRSPFSTRATRAPRSERSRAMPAPMMPPPMMATSKGPWAGVLMSRSDYRRSVAGGALCC